MDVVDKKDMVIKTVPKEEIYEKSLMHRLIHIWILNSEGNIASCKWTCIEKKL